MFLAVNIDRPGFNPVAALPQHRSAVVVNQFVTVRGTHVRRGALYILIPIQHFTRGLLLIRRGLVRRMAGHHVSIGHIVAGLLDQVNLVRVRGAVRVPNARPGLQIHGVRLLVERRARRLRMAVAILVSEVTGLPHGG